MALTENQIITLENGGFIDFDAQPTQYLYILSPLWQTLSSVVNNAEIIDFTHMKNVRKAPKLDKALTSNPNPDYQFTAAFTNETADDIPLDKGDTPTNEMVIKPGQTYQEGTVAFNISAINSVLADSTVEITQAKGHTFGQTGASDSFSIHGQNSFNISTWDQAIYSLDLAIAIKEEMSLTALRNGRQDPNEIVNDAMIAQAQLFSYQFYNHLINGTHQVKDGSTGSYSTVKNYGYARDLADVIDTYTTKEEYYNNVYNALVTEINVARRRGVNLASSVIIASLELITCLQLSYKRMGTGDLTKEEIENGFAGKVNGVLLQPDDTLGAGDAYSTGAITFMADGGKNPVPLSLIIVDIRPTLLSIRHYPVEKLRLQPGDSKEFDIIRAKAGEKWVPCIYEPKCISLYSLPAFVAPADATNKSKTK